MKAGLFGGTFNPIHSAHLIIAEWILGDIGLDCIYFIPTALSPHRVFDSSLAPIEHRKEMVRRAIRGNPQFRLGDYEAGGGNVTYSIDTVRSFLEDHPEASGNLYFIMGEDNYRTLPSWKEYAELARLATIVVARRSVNAAADDIPGIASPLRLRTPQVEISASEIRNRIQTRRSIRYLVPESVELYIREHNLYVMDNE